MRSYPALLLIASLTHILSAAVHYFVAWSQGVRDLEFLVELRLRNYDNNGRRKAIEERPVEEEQAVIEDVEEMEEMVDADVEVLWNIVGGERGRALLAGNDGEDV